MDPKLLAQLEQTQFDIRLNNLSRELVKADSRHNPYLEVIVESEFPFKEVHDPDENGCACFSLNRCWVFIDTIVSDRNVYEPDAVEQCWHCKKEKHCKIDMLLDVYVQEISRVTVHELVHLCGASEAIEEQQTREATAAIHKVQWDCPFHSLKNEGRVS